MFLKSLVGLRAPGRLAETWPRLRSLKNPYLATPKIPAWQVLCQRRILGNIDIDMAWASSMDSMEASPCCHVVLRDVAKYGVLLKPGSQLCL